MGAWWACLGTALSTLDLSSMSWHQFILFVRTNVVPECTLMPSRTAVYIFLSVHNTNLLINIDTCCYWQVVKVSITIKMVITFIGVAIFSHINHVLNICIHHETVTLNCFVQKLIVFKHIGVIIIVMLIPRCIFSMFS